MTTSCNLCGVCIVLTIDQEICFTFLLKGKSLLNPPPFIHGLLHPPTMKPSVLPPELSKTVYFTLRRFLTAVCYSNGGFECTHRYCHSWGGEVDQV